MERQKLERAKQVVALRAEIEAVKAERLAILPEQPTRGEALIARLKEGHRKQWGKSK